MDPVQRYWMFQNWVADQNDDAELAKNHAYLVGSFWNPEAVKQLMNENVHKSTDEEFEESSDMVKQGVTLFAPQKSNPEVSKKRRRRTLKE